MFPLNSNQGRQNTCYTYMGYDLQKSADFQRLLKICEQSSTIRNSLLTYTSCFI